MSDPALAALTSALDNSKKVSNLPFFVTVVDRITGFKLSEWSAQGDTIKRQILDGYEEAKLKGLGMQYVSAFRSNANLINTCTKAAKYIVSEVINVPKTELKYLSRYSDKDTLTLMTCFPPGTDWRRTIVISYREEPSSFISF